MKTATTATIDKADMATGTKFNESVVVLGVPSTVKNNSHLNVFFFIKIISTIIDRRIYLNLSKAKKSAAGLNVFKPAANGRFVM